MTVGIRGGMKIGVVGGVAIGIPNDRVQGSGSSSMSVTLIDNTDPVATSTNFTYTMTVANSGSTSITSITAALTLDASLVFVSASGTGWVCTPVGQVVSCTLGSLAGSTTANAITITVTSGAASITATSSAIVTATGATQVNASQPTTVVKITTDGPGAVRRPANLNEWLVFGSSVPVPDHYWTCQEASGNLTDDVEGMVLTVGSTPLYQQSQASWTSKCLKVDTETSTKGWGITLGWESTAQSIVTLCLARVISSGSAGRLLLCLGGSNTVTVLTTGILRFQSPASNVSGAVDMRDGLIHPILIEQIAGAGVGNHTGAGVYRLSTDKEQIVHTWQSNAGAKGMGAATLAVTPCVAMFNAHMVWVGSAAESISTIGPKAFLQSFGWVVTGY